MRIAIRRATPADRPAMLLLWRDAWSMAMPEIDFSARLPWLTHRLDALERDGAAILVAVAGRDIRGFVTVDAGTQELDQLVTAVQAQRQGVGKALLQAAQAYSPGGLSLKVNQVNAAAIRLYRAAGFEITGEGTAPRSGLPLFDMRWAAVQVRSRAR